jgi:hypothetical protein
LSCGGSWTAWTGGGARNSPTETGAAPPAPKPTWRSAPRPPGCGPAPPGGQRGQKLRADRSVPGPRSPPSDRPGRCVPAAVCSPTVPSRWPGARAITWSAGWTAARAASPPRPVVSGASSGGPRGGLATHPSSRRAGHRHPTPSTIPATTDDSLRRSDPARSGIRPIAGGVNWRIRPPGMWSGSPAWTAACAQPTVPAPCAGTRTRPTVPGERMGPEDLGTTAPRK